MCSSKHTVSKRWHVTGNASRFGHPPLEIWLLIHHLECHLSLWDRPLQIGIISSRQELHIQSKKTLEKYNPNSIGIAAAGVQLWAVYDVCKVTVFQKPLKVIQLHGEVWTLCPGQIDVVDREASLWGSISFTHLKHHLVGLGGIQRNVHDLPVSCSAAWRSSTIVTVQYYLTLQSRWCIMQLFSNYQWSAWRGDWSLCGQTRFRTLWARCWAGPSGSHCGRSRTGDTARGTSQRASSWGSPARQSPPAQQLLCSRAWSEHPHGLELHGPKICILCVRMMFKVSTCLIFQQQNHYFHVCESLTVAWSVITSR